MSVNPNKVITRRVYLPRPPSSKPGYRSAEIKTWLEGALTPFLSEFVRSVENDAFSVHQHVGGLTDRGADITSASTIEVSHRQHSVTGTATINRIDAEEGFRGFLYLLALEPWTLASIAPPVGNIAVSVAPAVNQLVVLVYDVETELWYPNTVGSGGGPSGGFAMRGETQLVGAKNGVNTLYTLPMGDVFWFDANGKIVSGPLIWKANILHLTTAAPSDFEYQVASSTEVLVGTPPLSGDYLAFLSLTVAA